MRKNYVLFRWLSARVDGAINQTRNTLLLLRTETYDVSIHRLDIGFRGFGLFQESVIGEERIWLRDRESGEKWGVVDVYCGVGGLIEKLIESKNRNRDLWKLELRIGNIYDGC